LNFFFPEDIQGRRQADGPGLRSRHDRWRALALLMLVGIASGTSGCSPRGVLIGEVGQIIYDGQAAYEQEPDLYLLSQSFPAHFKLMEALSINDPRNVQLLLLIARLYGGYAFAVLETEQEALRYDQPPAIGLGLSTEKIAQRMAHCFQTGAEYALNALAVKHPDVRERLKTAQGAASFFDSLGRADVPALFWYGFNLAGYIQHNLHSVHAMGQANRVESAMRRVIALDPGYYHGSAHLVMMVYYASRAPMMGGNPERAQWHYEQHRMAMPQPVRLRELYRARFMMVRGQQREAFTRTMSELSAEVRRQAPLALLDSVAAHRAAVYLRVADQFFD